ncbi:MAG: bifunctional YncE family protein/alkaline phosphatase family protein [Bryobacteraceae bacterium]
MSFRKACLVAIVPVALLAQAAPRERIGHQSDGSVLLNSGWSLRPAGKQVALGTFPMSMALYRDGKYLVAMNAGIQPPSLSILDVASQREVQRVPVPDAWLGLTFSPDGKSLYVGGGSRASVFEFRFSDGNLTPAREFVVAPAAQRTYRDFIGDVAVSPDGRLVYAADLYRDTIVVINPQSGRVIERYKTGRRPYRILFQPDGKFFYVSSWADGTVVQHETDSGNLTGRVPLGPHPTDMRWSAHKVALEGNDTAAPTWVARLFVAAANTNSVYVVGMEPGGEMNRIETIDVASSPMHPLGMTPSALALSRDETRLYVACSDANAVAVVDVSTKESRLQGFVPSGWYPTAVRSFADGQMVALNGRGMGGHPQGSASFIAPFDDEKLDAYSKTVLQSSPYDDRLLQYVATGPGNPIPSDTSRRSPIEHVVYIVGGSLSHGRTPGEDTPNLQKIARQFVSFGNFYLNADTSADGGNWTTAAIAPDYVEKLWPNSYAHRRQYADYEGQDVASRPPAGYLWGNALSAGRTVRNYGFFVQNRAQPGPGGAQIRAVYDPALISVTSVQYRGVDPNYADVNRAKVFLKDLAGFESAGTMPQLIMMRLGGSGAADNDAAIGMIAEAVSKSKFWPSTAVFIVNDDAQEGQDHVDSHRSPAFVLSPYARRGFVDTAFYDQTSVLRTIELILAMRPMTHFDAASRPLAGAFQPLPDLGPFTAEKP